MSRPPRLGRRPARTVLIAAGLAALLTGCGIQPTGAVDAGSPPGGLVPQSTSAPLLDGVAVYLYRGGELVPVVRPAEVERFSGIGDLNVITVGGIALHALLNGPSEADASAGLRTELPPGIDADSIGFRKFGLGLVEVVLDVAVDDLSSGARYQLSCTLNRAVFQRAAVRPVPVRLVNRAGEFQPLPGCPPQALTARLE